MNPRDSGTPQEDWDALGERVDDVPVEGVRPVLSLTAAAEPFVPDPLGEPPPPLALKGFVILEELGKGGMGIVYKARREDSGEVVAIKLLADVLRLDHKMRERFLTEAEAGRRLDHPNIIRTHELRQYGGSLFIILEFVEGESLAKRLGRTPLPEREAAELARTLADAVAFAHRQEVVHRDLKPSNVLLGNDGTVKLSDFGLARLLDAPGQTTDGRAIGTPSYMSPEQARADKPEIGHASDVYGLGATLYHMITGRPPFLAASTAATLAQVADRNKLAARPTALNAALSPAIEAVCLKCIEKEPKHRYASAAELADDLSRFLGGKRVNAPRYTRFRAALALARKNPVLTALVTALFLVVVLSAVSGYVLYGWETQARDLSDRRLFAQSLQSADRLGTSEPDAALDLLGDESRCPPRYRSFDWHLLTRRFAPPRDLAGHEEDVFSVDFSSDGERLATAGREGVIRVWDARTGKEKRRLTGHKAAVLALRFQPRGALLASVDASGRIAIWGVDYTPRELPTKQHGAVNGLAFSTDGKSLATGGEDGVIRFWDVQRGTLERELPGHKLPISALCFSPDGKLLVSGAGSSKVALANVFGVFRGGEVKCWNLTDYRNSDVMSGQLGRVTDLAFSLDGRYLAVAVEENTPLLLDADAGFRPVPGLAPARAAAVAFSPDGKYLALGSEPDSTNERGQPMAMIRVLELPSGRERFRFRGHPVRVHSVAFSPASSEGQPLLASGGVTGTVQLRRLNPEPDRSTITALRGPNPDASHVALSADGRRLLAARGKASLVWNVGRQEVVLRDLGTQFDSITAVALSPDGRRAALGIGREVRLWNLDSCGEPRRLLADQPVVALTFTPDGRTLIGAGDAGTVRIWDAESGEHRTDLVGATGQVSSLAFRDDGLMLAAGGERLDSAGQAVGGEVTIWQLPTGQLRRQFAHSAGGRVTGVAFSPDRKMLAFSHTGEGSRFGQVSLWHLAGRRLWKSWQVKQGAARAIVFSPDGRTLAALVGSEPSRAVQFWDIEGVERLRLTAPPGASELSLAPRGQRLATIGEDGTVILWDANAEQ